MAKASGEGGATRLLRGAYRVARHWIGQRRIPGLVRELQRMPPSRDAIMFVIARLRDAWGNVGYSADLGYLEQVVDKVLHSDGPFLECGSGLSTVVLGTLAVRTGAAVWSLEQDEEWAFTMRRRLAAAGLHHVHVVHAPLVPTGNGDVWYAFDQSAMPHRFATVFCDGPAVRKSQWPYDVYLAWRTPLVAELHSRDIAFGEIVLDDEEDRRSGRLIATWRRAGLQTDVVVTPFGRHIIATWPLSGASVTARTPR